MLATNLESVTASLLQSVCDGRWSESISVEFKREAPGTFDRDKHELLKDVCAMANAEGGDITFGINEVDGAASAITPISAEPGDALMRRIAQTIESGLEPRVLGIRLHRVDVVGGYVLVLRVPPSYQGPHGIKVNTSRRFVMRTGTTTSDLTFDQLRTAFDRTASLAERARAFTAQRIDALSHRKTPKPLIHGPIRALHFVPIGGLSGRQAIDLQALHGQPFTRLLESDWGGGSRVFNLDGLVVYPGAAPDDGHYGYAQAFRNGAFEAASLGGGSFQQHPSMLEKLVVWSLDMSKWFRERSATILSLAKDFGLSGPAVISFSMLHVEEYELTIDAFFPRRGFAKPDRPHLVAPEIWIDNLESTEVDDFARPLLDTLWQGFGMERCMDYEPGTGAYKPRRQ